MPRNFKHSISNILVALWKDQRGVSMAEYALLMAFIAVGTIGAVSAFEIEILALFSKPLIP